MPTTPHITVETIQSGFCIYRAYDTVVECSPPTRLRRYDLILPDEASQVDDDVTKMVFVAVGELPVPLRGCGCGFLSIESCVGREAHDADLCKHAVYHIEDHLPHQGPSASIITTNVQNEAASEE